MIRRTKQRGITLTSFVFVLMVLGFFAYTAMQLFPIYSEHMAVVDSMEALSQEPGVSSWETRKIRDMLDRRFDISYVESVKAEHIKIERTKGGRKLLTITYEVRKPYAYNIDIVAKFSDSVEL